MGHNKTSVALTLILLVSIMIGCARVPEGKIEREVDPTALINSLHTQRNETLYYDEDKYPENVKELIASTGNIEALISAYRSDDADHLFRFNIIMILNQKRESGAFQEKKGKIMECFRDALSDSSPWVRTEAVWGLGRSGYDIYVPEIIPLLDDADHNVINEAILALEKLTGYKTTDVSNQDMSPAVRALAVTFWKDWWNKNKGKYQTGSI